jgi:hypothetical protein
MHVSTAQEAILERIGHTLADVSEDLTTEPLPEPMLRLLEQSSTPHPHATTANILCELIEALTHPHLYRLFERNGEFFLEPVRPD